MLLLRLRHRLRVFGDSTVHFDYLPGTPCYSDDEQRGPCGCTPNIVADCVTMFFGKYLPPPGVPDLPEHIPDLLRPPSLVHGPVEPAFETDYLDGFGCLEADSRCVVGLSYETESGSASETIPTGQDLWGS